MRRGHQMRARATATRAGRALALALSTAAAAGCRSADSRTDLAYFPAPPGASVAVRLRVLDLAAGGKASGRARSHPPAAAGLAYRGGTLYVCEPDAGRVLAWDLASGRARTIGASPSAPLRRPVSVCLDETGRIFIADAGRAEVVVCASDGSQIWRLGAPGGSAWQPCAVAAGAGRIYVADAAGGRVCVFDSDSEDLMAELRSPAHQYSTTFRPTGLGLDARRRLYVLDGDRVWVFDEWHAPVATFAAWGPRREATAPGGQLAVGPNGSLAITDPGSARLALLNPEGWELVRIDTPAPPFGVVWAGDWPEAFVGSGLPDGFHADALLFVGHAAADGGISLYAVATQPAR